MERFRLYALIQFSANDGIAAQDTIDVEVECKRKSEVEHLLEQKISEKLSEYSPGRNWRIIEKRIYNELRLQAS